MSDDTEFSPDVLEALRAGRKIEAIKMLRMQRGLDLAEAREQVDLYIADHPQHNPRQQHREMNLVPLLVAAAIAVAAWFAFEHL